IVALAQRGGHRLEIVPQIEMAEGPAPDIVRLQSQSVKGEAEVAALKIESYQGLQLQPGPRFSHQIGIKVGKSFLVPIWPQPPIGIDVPVQEVFDSALALGLQFIAQAETEDILTVDRVDGVVIGKLYRQQTQARQFVIELRQLVRGMGGRGDEDIVE